LKPICEGFLDSNRGLYCQRFLGAYLKIQRDAALRFSDWDEKLAQEPGCSAVEPSREAQ